MNRRTFLSMQTGAVGALSVGPLVEALTAAPSESKSRRGVSIAGAEFGTHVKGFSNHDPGVADKDYTYNTEPTYKYFCEQKLPLLRIPFRWERLQPRLGQALDETELKQLKTAVAWAKNAKGSVILDLHNYARYFLWQQGQVRECVIDEKVEGRVLVSREHLADAWRRISEAFASEPAVVAYGLMNEPHDMGLSNWRTIAQEAVDAIRRRKDNKLILVAGNDWSGAKQWVRANGPTAWIRDPLNNTAYEAHCYFDADGSGHYAKSYDAELAADSRLEKRGPDRLQPFLSWCNENRVRGFLGEFGVPGSDPRWLKLLPPFLDALRQKEMDWCYWAAGEWWGDYPLSIQPKDQFKVAAPRLKFLKG